MADGPGLLGGAGGNGGGSVPPAHPLQQEILRLRAANQAAAKENSQLRGEVADRQFECEQLDKTVRKLERKIDALEDVGVKKGTIAKGFFKPAPAEGHSPLVERRPPEKPKPKAWEKAKADGSGVIIDSSTGDEVDPSTYWPEETEKAEENILLRASGHSPEAELMREMQNPPEVNADFDTRRYTELVGGQRQTEAEDMIRKEGGPTAEQMQRLPLEVLRKYPNLDVNWCDPTHNHCSLLQWACSMGYDEVTLNLLQRRADANYRTPSGNSCLAAACAQNWAVSARHLLAHRADPSEVLDAGEGRTILMWASRIEFCDLDGREHLNPFVSMLLEYSANHEAVDQKGKTALMHASTEGNYPAVQALLAARADVDVQDREGNTALQIALKYYHGKISALLVPLRRKVPAEA